MRIFLIGNSKANAAFSEYFSQDKNNIVFSTMDKVEANFVDICPQNIDELKDFALANEINLTILCDEKTILGDIKKEFENSALSVFAPEGDATRIFSSKIWAKKFIYRNKVLTPRFQVFEKPQAALDWVRQNKFPTVIKPDGHSEISTRLCETFGSARGAIEEFFSTGSKRILIEDYIWGKEFSVYTVLDGYNPIVVGECATYQNSIAKIGADFLDDAMRAEIFNDIILPLTCALVKENDEYTGFLGFDFILADKKIYLLECNSMFRDLDANMNILNLDENWGELLNSALEGTLVEKYQNPKFSQKYFWAYQGWQNGEKLNITSKGRTLNEAKNNLIEDCDCKVELEEAQKIWKS